MSKRKHFFVAVAVGLSSAAGAARSAPMGTAFTFQGYLEKPVGTPLTDTCDFRFGLWDAADLGVQKGSSPQTKAGVAVADGVVTIATLDFGPGAIDGNARWLEIEVQCPGDDDFVKLEPRVELTPVPHALALPGLYTQENATSPNIIGGYSGNTVTAGAMGATISGGGVAWMPNQVTDDYGTVGGGGGNRAGDGVAPTWGAVNATVGGGQGNQAFGAYSVVGGGELNIATNPFSTVGGGQSNTASDLWSTVGGGRQNTATAENATVAGGYENTASGTTSTVGGGDNNSASGTISTVGGGESNTASGPTSTVGGGNANTAGGHLSTVGGGGGNAAEGEFSTVGGGNRHVALAGGSTIAGGGGIAAESSRVCVGGPKNRRGCKFCVGGTLPGTPCDMPEHCSGGGVCVDDSSYCFPGTCGPDTHTGNSAMDNCATVGGGWANWAGMDDGNVGSQHSATVAGGSANRALAENAFVGGGYVNTASGTASTVAGGDKNIANSYTATVPGGFSNQAGGWASFAAGWRAKVRDATTVGDADGDQGTFVWADLTDADFTSTGSNQFLVRASGGTKIYSNAALTAGVTLAAGGSAWAAVSDKNSKENFAEIDYRDLLQRLAAVPVTTWNYKAQDASIRHIGVMAQDFYAAFGVGEEETKITTIDADGVALAAIQGLYEVVKDKECRIDQLEGEKAALEARVAALEAMMARVVEVQNGGAR